MLAGKIFRTKAKFFIPEEFWLIFNLLELRTQEWIQMLAHMWENCSSYNLVREYVETVSVTNNVAKRGTELITDFSHQSKDGEQRQALLQMVEHLRNMFPNYKKYTLVRLC